MSSAAVCHRLGPARYRTGHELSRRFSAGKGARTRRVLSFLGMSAQRGARRVDGLLLRSPHTRVKAGRWSSMLGQLGRNGQDRGRPGPRVKEPHEVAIQDVAAVGPLLVGRPALTHPAAFASDVPIGDTFLGRRLRRRMKNVVQRTRSTLKERHTPHRSESGERTSRYRPRRSRSILCE
jgi:hypothetical protein